MRTILDIPDAALLSSTEWSLDDLINTFCTQVGVNMPDVICLPLWDEGGSQIDSPYAQRSTSPWSANYHLDEVIELIRQRYSECQIYLSIMPDMPPTKIGFLTTRSQYDNEKPGTCLVNPYVQDLLVDYVNDVRKRYDPQGIVWDTVDIQGQSAEQGIVEVTCFCYHCREALKARNFDPAVFKPPVNPLNLVLQETGTGIRPVNIKSRMDAKDLQLLASVQHMYDTKAVSEDVALAWAQIILDYARFRSKITGDAIGSIGRRLKAEGAIRTVAILNFPHFDWTGGADLKGMEGNVDEVWMDIDDLQPHEISDRVEVYHYMADRSRYAMDNYFETVSRAGFIDTYVRRGSREPVDALVRARQSRMMAAQNIGVEAIQAVRHHPKIAGVVGAPLDPKHIDQITRRALEYARALPDQRAQEQGISKEQFQNYISNLIYLNEEQKTEIDRQVLIQLARQMGLLNA